MNFFMPSATLSSGLSGLVRRDVEGNVGLVDGSGSDVGDESDRLGEGNGVGEGLGGRGALALRGSSPNQFTGFQPSGSISNASVSR
jgi:hypothetical protein